MSPLPAAGGHTRIGRHLPFVPTCTYRHGMEGILRWPRSRASEYERDHPDVSIYEGEFGEHYAWKAAPGDRLSGELTHGRTEEELLAKLGGAA